VIFIAIGVTGVTLFAIASNDYSNFSKSSILFSTTGLRGWVSFYHEHSVMLLTIPILLILTGVIGVFLTVNLSRSVVENIMARFSINTRELALVIVVAAIVGGGSGWLGANFNREWINGGDEQARPRFNFDEREKQRRDDALDRRLRCLEDITSGYRHTPCY